MRKQLSKSDIKNLNDTISVYGIELSKKDKVEIVDNFILVNNQIIFFNPDNPIPTLKTVIKKNLLKKITVDMGAIKFVANGADVMRPGITDIDLTIKKDEIIVIIDINNKKQLAIGKALYGADEMKHMTSGKVIQNLHYVGDEIWKSDS